MGQDALDREFDVRPWGNYTVLADDASDYKVKQIVVEPGRRLSYQTHKKRAEHWIVISGEATVVLDGRELTVGPGQTVEIPIGAAHRCENHGTSRVVFVEVQTGTYFGEDDIVRLQDDYGRVE